MLKNRLTTALCVFVLVPGILFSVKASRNVQTPSRDSQVRPQVASLIINEYLADPGGSAAGDLEGDANGDGTRDAADDEFVEIVNNGAEPLNVGLFTISDATQVRFTIPAGKIIPPGESAVVFGGGTPTGDFGNAAANGLVFAAGGAGLSLNNGGDTITIRDNLAVTAASVTFGSAQGGANQSITLSPDITGSFTTHSTAAGSGGALFSPGARVNGGPFTTTDPVISSISPAGAIAGSGDVTMMVNGANFEAGSTVRVNGVPVFTGFVTAAELSALIPSSVTDAAGTYQITVQNSGGAISNAFAFTVLGQIGINEYLADPPDGLDGDANGDGTRDSAQDEFVEIVNRTGSPIDVGGFTLRDADGLRFTFPSGSIIPAGEAAVIFGGGTPQGDFGNVRVNGLLFTAALSLNNTGDTIELRNASASIVESITFGSVEGNANQSINRNPDVSGIGFAPHSNVPGSGGKLFSPGTLVNGAPFSVGPRITSISPDNANNGAPAFDMDVLGSGFEGTSVVFIDGQAVTTMFVNPGHLIANVPTTVTATNGLHPVQVRNEGGNRSNIANLTIIAVAGPTITSISPGGAVAGSGDVTITVIGTNFEPGSAVRVDGVPVSTSFVTAVELTAEIPPSITNASGTYLITVRNPVGTISNAVAFTVLGQLGINEYLADPPDGLPGDANGDGTRDSAQDEFVEIVNRTGAPINVGGFTIRDADALRFTFPSGTVIPGGEAAVVFGGGSPQGSFGNVRANGLLFTASLSLNNGGDTIELRNSSAVVIESITFGSVEGNANQSINRNPDVEGLGFATHSSIAGSGGGLFSPGTLVNGSPFTVAPHLVSIAPNSADRDAAPFDIAVLGTGFEGTSTVLIDGQAVSTTFVDAGRLVANVPASVTAISGAHSVQVRNEGGNRSNSVTLTIIPPAPILSEISPKVLLIGGGPFTMFLAGLNFSPGAVVLIDGTPVATTFLTVLSIRATVPASFLVAGGNHAVVVRNSDGKQSNAAAFNVVPPTTVITSISPATAIAGGPGFAMLVRGANYKNNAAVSFDGTELATTFRSPAELNAQVPASLITKPGVHTVSVRNPDESPSNDAVFQVFPDAPLIASLDPPSVIEGSGDVTVTINGERFQPGAIVRVVEATQRGAKLDTTFFTAEKVIAKVPGLLTQTPGAVSLAVENPDLGLSSTVFLRVLIKDPIVINEYLADPADSQAGDANGDGTRSSSADEFIEILNRSDEPFNISGYRIFDSDAVRHVFAAGTIVPPFETVVVFGGGTPTGAFGNAADNHMVFKASTGGLSLNNGGDTIRFEDAQGHVIQEIKFGAAEGGAGQSINRDPDGDGATFTLHTIVAADVSRLFSPGSRAAGQTFTIKPVISGMTPATIRVGSVQFTLTIFGDKFLPGAVVLLGDTPLPTVFHSNTQLEAQVAAHLVALGGAADVRVENPRGELSTAARLLIADDPPRVSAITPKTTGTGADSLEVSVTGERFQSGAIVRVQSQSVETRFVSSTTLIAIVPSTLFVRATDLTLSVLNTDGNASNTIMLTVENGPLITRLSRTKIKTGGGTFELTVGGVAFKPGVVLFANGIALSTTFINEGSFTARIPGEMTNQSGALTLQARHPDGGRSNTAKLKVR